MANEPGFILNEQNGGINWGNCVAKSTTHPQVDYSISIVTSPLPLSGTR
jgi:hypothetical protein